jgi:hypothetical protein
VRQPRELPYELEPFASEFYFVQAKAQDNPFLPASYHKSLESLPPSMRAAYSEGSWDRFEGQYFNVFDADSIELTYRAFEQFRAWQYWQPVWISFDWGKDSHHSYVSWHTFVVLHELEVQPETGRLDNKATIEAERAKVARGDDGSTSRERVVIITYRERLVKDLSEEALAEQIWDWTPPSERKLVRYIFGSKDLGLSGELDGGTRMSSVFARREWPPLQGAFNNRVSGWQVMYDKLRDRFVRADMPDDSPWPMWLIVGEVPGKKDFGCPLALKALQWAMADPDHDGDIIKKGDAPELDVLDGLRYGIASYARMEEKPVSERRREAIAAVPQQARFTTGMRFDLEERQKAQPFYIGSGQHLSNRWQHRRRH